MTRLYSNSVEFQKHLDFIFSDAEMEKHRQDIEFGFTENETEVAKYIFDDNKNLLKIEIYKNGILKKESESIMEKPKEQLTFF